jgi:hypothetical protein
MLSLLLLQYHVVQDSLSLAHILVKLRTEYKPAYQLGLDMLYRLGAFTDMMRVLLSHNQVLEALQLVPHTSAVFKEPGLTPADFLAKAFASSHTSIFYTAFRFFQVKTCLEY